MSKSIAALTFLVAAAAAHAGGATVRLSNIVISGAPRIEAVLTVLDDAGTPVTDVKPDELFLAEGSAHIGSLEISPRKTPVDLAVVFDQSAKAAALAAPLKAALETFFAGLSAQDRVALVGCADATTVLARLTADRAKLKAGLARAHTGGGAAIRQGIVDGVGELAGSGPRGAILLIAAGRDVNAAGTAAASKVSLKVAAKAAHDLQLPIWIVPVGGAATDALYAKLAAVTGGIVFPASAPDQIGDALTRVLAALHHQYRATYKTPAPITTPGARLLSLTFTRQGTPSIGKAKYTVTPPGAEENKGFVDVPEEQVGPPPDMDPYQ